MALLVDTGVLYALADTDDRWHARAVAWLEQERELLAVPVTVLPEACYLLAVRLSVSAERRFIDALVAGEMAVEPLTAADLARVPQLLERHPEIGFVDASIVAMAERLGTMGVATTDRRHFGSVRPRHVAALELVP
jgi:predicted nucleic acid-binding protein